MRLILPIVLALLGLAAGTGTGLFLRPAQEPVAAEQPPRPSATTQRDFARLPNQYVVPVVEGGRVAAMVVMSLSLEVEPGGTEAVLLREPRLRDSFLKVMFDHANAGGFRGNFTDGTAIAQLRRALLEAAVAIMGPMVTDVLITDYLRQDQ